MSKSLFLLRGAPASGKSSWVAENNLEEYTVAADKVRISMLGLNYDENGNPQVPQTNQWVIWRQVNRYIEARMINEDQFIILDATNLYTKHMKKYRTIANRYGYNVYVVDFTDIPIEYCYEHNRFKGYDKVPEYIIDRFYALQEYNLLPDGFVMVTRDEALQIIHDSVDSKDSYNDRIDE